MGLFFSSSQKNLSLARWYFFHYIMFWQGKKVFFFLRRHGLNAIAPWFFEEREREIHFFWKKGSVCFFLLKTGEISQDLVLLSFQQA